jgi:hypothetical protein
LLLLKRLRMLLLLLMERAADANPAKPPNAPVVIKVASHPKLPKRQGNNATVVLRDTVVLHEKIASKIDAIARSSHDFLLKKLDAHARFFAKKKLDFC